MVPKPLPGAPDGTPPDALFVIGEILKPRGVAGEIKTRVLCDGPDHLAECLEPGEVYVWKLPSPGGRAPADAGFSPRRIAVRSLRFHAGYAILQFEGVDSIEDADALRGALIGLPEDRLPASEPDSFYYHQLENLEIFGADGVLLGTVLRVEESPAHAQLLVLPADEGRKPFRIPLIEAFVKGVNTDAGRIDVNLPNGLIESQT